MILDGLRVVDLSRVLAGPHCAQLLAEGGATVIKVESPEGDENRRWTPIMPDGLSSNFHSVNRGKRFMTLDLKSPSAGAVLRRLAEWADVMLHSFLPDTAERLGISYETMKAINPRLIFCSISGYGAKGPLRNKPGYDLMVQAFSGSMSVTGYEGGPPVRTGVSYIDMATGLSAYGGIMTALYARTTTGTGTWVRASLLETAVSLMGYHAVAWLQDGIIPVKQGSGGANQAPYQAFRCRDGFILVGAPNNAAWARLCGALRDEALGRDPRFATNASRVEHKAALVPLLEAHFTGGTAVHWAGLLEAAGVAVSPIQTIDQVLTHPQVLANDMVVSAQAPDGTARPLVGMPFKVGDQPPERRWPAGGLGADTAEILRDVLGFDDDAIERCRDAVGL
ncbi:MAG TPA: CoA transferase [Rhodopila sp.]|uniref:CaiB/BaiF CoA transferase family protein n=1 Tax=Rhodopila sp. TaxID=2480087 RepID=UPI002B9D55BE|nr:CoA transferase [Rhodopila sp.]HVY13695.1 CoA transferase [Rhodopila sp.]